MAKCDPFHPTAWRERALIVAVAKSAKTSTANSEMADLYQLGSPVRLATQ